MNTPYCLLVGGLWSKNITDVTAIGCCDGNCITRDRSIPGWRYILLLKRRFCTGRELLDFI